MGMRARLIVGIHLAAVGVLTPYSIATAPIPAVITRSSTFDLFPPIVHDAITQFLDDPTRSSRTLLESNDPLDRGAGIFLADFRGEVDELLRARDLLFDDRPTIPNGINDPASLRYPPEARRLIFEQQSVSKYLAIQYRLWLGADVRMTTAQLHDYIAAVERDGSLWKHAHAWTRKYLLAEDEHDRAAVVTEIIALPANLRWWVSAHMISVGGRPELRDDALRIADSVPSTVRTAILEGETDLPPDPQLRQPERVNAMKRSFETAFREHARKHGA